MLNFGKNHEYCGILTCLDQFPSPQLQGRLENQQTATTVKATSPTATGGVEWGWSSLKAPIPNKQTNKQSFLAYVEVLWEILLIGLIFIWPNLQLSQDEQPFPGAFVKNYKQKLFNTAPARGSETFGASKKVIKAGEWDVQKNWRISGNLKGCSCIELCIFRDCVHV